MLPLSHVRWSIAITLAAVGPRGRGAALLILEGLRRFVAARSKRGAAQGRPDFNTAADMEGLGGAGAPVLPLNLLWDALAAARQQCRDAPAADTDAIAAALQAVQDAEEAIRDMGADYVRRWNRTHDPDRRTGGETLDTLFAGVPTTEAERKVSTARELATLRLGPSAQQA